MTRSAGTRRRVFFIHWNTAEARERVATTRVPGFTIEYEPLENGTSSAAWKRLRQDLPDVVLIDLSRLPSHGREIALALRSAKKTFYVPIVFVGGERAKVEATRAKVKDAIYCEWQGVAAALGCAVTAPPKPVERPKDLGSSSPLWKKLGIKEGSRVFLVDAPDTFDAALGDLPKAVAITRGSGERHGKGAATFDVIVCFVRTRAELALKVKRHEERVGRPGGLWIAWPKKASKVRTDVTEDVVREIALPRGLVDNKVCSIDSTWSGLRLAWRAGTPRPVVH